MNIAESDVGRILESIERTDADERSVSFMMEAVKDIQGTIRGIDTKVGILLAGLAIPIPLVQGAFVAMHQHGVALTLQSAAGWLAFIVYVLAALIAVRALTGIGNAAQHVSGDETPDDIFYAGGLFPLGFIDAILTRSNITSRRSRENFIAAIPRKVDDVLAHLAHEVLSLAYIRDLKIHRQQMAFELTAVAIVLGAVALVL
ncbi:MAG: hypothetical protein ABI186_09740 [Candidatus Elarobacter sp.]